MATSEIDEIFGEGRSFVQRLKQAAVILAHRNEHGLSRRDKKMILQQLRYQQRLEVFEQDRARTWYGDRVEHYRQQSAHVAALHKLGHIDARQRMQASTYLSGLRESIETSVHHTALSGVDRGQVVHALDGVDRDPFARRQTFREQLSRHDEMRARYAAARSEYDVLQREQAAQMVIGQATGRDQAARIDRGQVNELDVAQAEQRNRFMRHYFETYGRPVDFEAKRMRPWERAAEPGAAQGRKPYHATVTARFDADSTADETRIEAFENGHAAIGWMREQLREPGIDRASVDLTHAEHGRQFRFVKGDAHVLGDRLAKIADAHHDQAAESEQQERGPVDRMTSLQARIDQLEADNKRLLGERDEAVRKLVARTPEQDRYGSGRRINGKTSPAPEYDAEQTHQQTGPVRSH